MELPLVKYEDLNLIDYKQAWEYQEKLFKEIIDIKISNRDRSNPVIPLNHILFCEHPHVFTLGKSGKEGNLLADSQELSSLNASYYKINRGGDITYHGPGQLVVYPILDLEQFFTDIHKYLRFLEEAVIRTLADFGIIATRIDGLTGVWILGHIPRKICAFGVKSSRWVTMHGIGFNINTNLTYFDNIIPCGINDKQVTSMKQELGHSPDFNEVKMVLLNHLQLLFNYRIYE